MDTGGGSVDTGGDPSGDPVGARGDLLETQWRPGVVETQWGLSGDPVETRWRIAGHATP